MTGVETHVQHENGRSASNSAQQCRSTVDNGHIPLLRNLASRNHGSIVQNRDEDHCHHRKGTVPWNFVMVLQTAVLKPFFLITACGSTLIVAKKKNNTRSWVDHVILHPPEDLPSDVNSFHND